MRSSQIRKLILLPVLVALIAIAGSVQIAAFIIEYNWWKEVEQVETWLSMLWYQIAPAAAGTLITFIALWLAHARGLQFAGLRFRDLGLYSRLVPVALLMVAALLASASIDYWAVMSYAGARHITLPAGTPWRDPVFSRTLPFYLFDLPFYSDLLTFAFVLSILSIVVFWATARGWQVDWSKYDLGSIVFNHPLLSAERLHFEKTHAWRRFYSLRSIIKRLGLPKTRGDLVLWIANLAVNGALKYRWGKNYRTWNGKDPGLVADPLLVFPPHPVKVEESNRLVKLASSGR